MGTEKQFTWSIYKQVHIVPDDDVKVHDATGKCWCKPEIKWVGKLMKVIHNALDGREEAESFIEEINNFKLICEDDDTTGS